MELTQSKKLQTFQSGIFNELNAYKREKEASGIHMIDLSIGSPDQGPSKELREAFAKAVLDETQYGYSIKGTHEFHQSVLSFYDKRYHVVLNEEEVLLLMGSQDGLVHLPMTLCDEGDLVLVPDPGYTAYEAGILLAGANSYPMPLLRENDFLPDLSKIPEEIAKKAKLMILNFPGNPVPALATKAFFEEVVAFAKKYHIFVVHDFAYSELIFEGKPLSFLSIEGAKEVGVEFNSLSKSFNLAGCRIAYLVGHPQMIDMLGRLKSNLDYGVFLPIQKVASLAMTQYVDFCEGNCRTYQKRRDVLIDGLNEVGWKVEKPKATMFVWAKVPKGYTSTTFTYALMDKAHVVVTPGQAFGACGEGYVRMALVQNEDTLKEAVKRIKESSLIEL